MSHSIGSEVQRPLATVVVGGMLIGPIFLLLLLPALRLAVLRRVKFAKKREGDRKSTRLNSSHSQISYAVFCLKKKKKKISQSNEPKRRTAPQDITVRKTRTYHESFTHTVPARQPEHNMPLCLHPDNQSTALHR